MKPPPEAVNPAEALLAGRARDLYAGDMMSRLKKIPLWFWAALTLVAAVFLFSANVYDNAFLYDDEFLIQKNRLLRNAGNFWSFFFGTSTTGAGGVDSFYRPMQGLLYWIVYQTAGLSTAAFHFLNLALHAANVVLVFALGRRLGLREAGAWAGALVWAVHPMHVEAVTYMSATADPLHALFILLSLWFFLRDGAAALGASAAFAVLSLVSKESAVVLPALAVVCVFFQSERRWHPRTYLRTLPLWLIVLGYLLLRKLLLSDSYEMYRVANIYSENLGYRVLTFLATLPSYVGLLFWPTGLHMDRAFPVFTAPAPAVWGGLAILILGGGIVWRQRRRPAPVAAWAVLWFFAAHIPHMGILIPVNSLFLEHWMYLPTMGLFLAAGHGVAGWLGRWVPFAAAAPVLALGIATFRQNDVWENPIRFYSNILDHNPKSARVRNNLAMAYADQGNIEAAAREYETAIAISDEYPQTHHNLGLLRAQQGRYADAIRELERAIQMNPDFHYSYEYLARIHGFLGHTELKEQYERKHRELLQRFDPGP